jgi:S-adenosylmethionine uptake transporter
MAQPAGTRAIPLDHPVKGIACILTGVSVFSIQDVAIKLLSGGYPVFEIVFVRSLVALPPLVAIAALTGSLGSLRTGRPLVHLLRGLTMFVAYGCYYLSLAALSLAETVSLYFSAPLFLTALSAPLLGERVGLRRWAAVAAGFLGVLIMMRPEAGPATLAAFLAVGAAFAYALSAIMSRRLGATESGVAMAFTASLVYIGAAAAMGLVWGEGRVPAGDNPSLAFLLRAWHWPSGHDFGLMAFCGLIAAVGFYFLAQAYRLAPAATVAPFEYVALPWAVLWGYLFWDDLPERRLAVGIALVIGSGLYVLRREALRGRRVAAGRALRPRL